jgi:ATP-binding cassette subfamily F protein 3
VAVRPTVDDIGHAVGDDHHGIPRARRCAAGEDTRTGRIVSLIAVNGVAFDYAGETLLRDVSFAVERSDRWGVIGRNGSGKTTLFRLIAGTLEPVAGSIAREAGVRITVLDQHRDFGAAITVHDAAASPFAWLIELERSLEEQAHALEKDASPAALDRYDRDLQRFERGGGHTFRATIDAVLEGLGFDAGRAPAQRIDTLSGGERGRLGLARQLAAPADVLLLDEPTNHLDLETTRWLEEFLLRSDATLLVISHDRAFLDRITDHTLHLEAGTAFAYQAGYAKFVVLRNERREAQQRTYDLQQRRVAAEEDYIRRNIAGQNSRQAKGRRTRLARLPRLSPPPSEEGTMALRLNAGERGGDQVLFAKDVRIAIGARVLVDDFTTRVARGDVIGLIGPNGAGKSTLLRPIAGERPPDAGDLRLGTGITVAHYRQDLAQVPIASTLFNAIHDQRPHWDRGQVQAHLGRFGFSGDEVQRVAGTLSGGEQARLALALIVLSRANLLLFDEPTNHLDVESIEALEDAILAFDGTVILISHDRALLEALPDRIWALHDTHIEDFPGDFIEWNTARAEREKKEATRAAGEAAEARARDRALAKRLHADRQARASERRAARRAVEAAEARAHELEGVATALSARLHDPALYETAEGVTEANALRTQLERTRAELDVALDRWAAAELAAAQFETDDDSPAGARRGT